MNLNDFMSTLPMLSKVYLFIAIPFTLFLGLTAVMSVLGAELHSDASLEHADASDGPGGILQVFTLKGIFCGLAVFGWVGFSVAYTSNSFFLSLIIALLAGLGTARLVGIFTKFLLSRQSNGAININNALNMTAQVYLTVKKTTGKVNAMVQGKYVELEATSDFECPTGSTVKIIGISGDKVVVVPLTDQMNVKQLNAN